MTDHQWMSPERWRELEPLLDAALELRPEQRPAFIREASCGDDTLHDELGRLVAECATPDVSLDGELQASFAELLEEDRLSSITLPPLLAARFQIKGELRRGRNASVYLASDLRHERDVAVKVLQPALAALVGADRFLAEIRVTANLRHPHIVPLFESGEADGWIYYVMPLIEGETLRARLERKGALPVAEAVCLLRDIAGAVAHAHDHGVVHLDIKPDNVLLGAGGPMVTDFGLAKALRDSPLVAAIGAGRRPPGPSVLVAGTPGYMSPEQLEGTADVDARSDVYSLGVLAWEMFAGERLFPAHSPEELRDAHLHQAPVPLSRHHPDVPEAVSAVVHRALAKTAGARFASAGEFREALAAVVDDSLPRRSIRWKLPVVLTVAALLLIVGAFAVKARSARAAATAARELYDRGLREHNAGNGTEANRLFLAALAKDSTLAIAAMGAAGYAADSATWVGLAGSALRHSGRAPDRERLQIRLLLARVSSDPTAVVIADSLRLLDPQHPESHFDLGNSLASTGDFLASLPHFQRAIDLDSAGLAGTTPNCIGCQALEALTWTYFSADSLEAGERVARGWTVRQPRRFGAWYALAWSLAHRGMEREAMDAWREAVALAPSDVSRLLLEVQLRMYLGDYVAADRLIDDVRRSEGDSTAGSRLWWSVISLRNQGRHREALDAARQFERASPQPATATVPRAVILFETGHHREARELFEGMTNPPLLRGASLPSVRARVRTWGLARAATAAAAMMDTTALKMLADTIERVGRFSPLERDRRLHHYVRANVLVMRGSLDAAAEMYWRALESPTFGYTRINVELGRVLLRLKRPAEAVVVLRAALNGPLESSNYYITRTELHDVLAHAYDVAGIPDSAAVHYRRVASAWANGDSPFKVRADAAERWLERYSAR